MTLVALGEGKQIILKIIKNYMGRSSDFSTFYEKKIVLLILFSGSLPAFNTKSQYIFFPRHSIYEKK